MWELLKRAARLLDDYAEYAMIVVLYGYFVAIILIEIALRYLFNMSTAIGEETARHAFIWLSWIAASLAVKKRVHISIHLFMDRLSYRGQALLTLVNNILFIVLATAVIYYTLNIMSDQYNYGTLSRAARYPMYVAYMGIPLGYVLIIIRLIQNIKEDARAYRLGEPPRQGGALF